VRNIAKPVAGGIFRGSAGVLGQENFNLNRPASGDPGAASFCRSALGAQLDRIFSSPTDYNVDVATRLFRSDGSGGAIRGQLAASASTGGGATGALFGTLSGKSIVAQDGTTGAGDKDAYGSFTAIRDGNTLCFGLTVAALGAPLAANIQSGATGAGGQIVVKLNKIPSSGTAGASAGCMTVDASALSGLFSSPSKYFVDDDFRDGAIGGQLRLGR
jgi:CHRD domain